MAEQRNEQEFLNQLDHFAEIPPDPRAMEHVLSLMMAGVADAAAPAGGTAEAPAPDAGPVAGPVAGARPGSVQPGSVRATSPQPGDLAAERLFRLLTLLFGGLAVTAVLTWEFWLPWLLDHRSLLYGLLLFGGICLITPLMLLPVLKAEPACPGEGGNAVC